MTFAEFEKFLQKESQPPPHLTPVLEALWYAKKKDWDRAHQIAQNIKTQAGSWIHAHLHRVEGDLSNADYWYELSGRTRPATSLEEEWNEIVKNLLNE